MKLEVAYYAFALFCATPEDKACTIVESTQSPHATQEACVADLQGAVANIVPEHLDTLMRNGGRFNAQCLMLPEGFNPLDHPEEIKKQLGGPSTNRPPAVDS